MCGHFAINYLNLKNLIERFGLEYMPPEDISDIFNDSHFYPSHGGTHTQVPVLLDSGGRKRFELFRWDIVPSWWNKPLKEKKFSTFNARSETLEEKTTFKNAWHKGKRCIIPATSFFEWPDKKLAPDKQDRIEHRITLTDQEIFAFAGLWDECVLPGNVKLFSCTLITVDANEKMQEIPHTRMPFILLPEMEAKWLDPALSSKDAFQLISQYPSGNMRVEKYY